MAAPNTITTSQLTYFGDDNPDGVSVGQSTSDKVSFYGVTPIVQRSSASQAAVATTAISAVDSTVPVAITSTTTGAYGLGSSQAISLITTVNLINARQASVVTLVNELRAALVALGAIKGSS